MRDLVVFGSARTDAFLELPTESAEKHCDIDTRRCVIELTYGAKVPLNGVTFEIGGNGANVSVGTKRLGVSSILVAELGDGALATEAINYLKKWMDADYLTQTKGVDQGFGAVIMYGGERTILSYYSDQEPVFPDDVCSVKWTYLTSVGEKFENYYEDVYKWHQTCGGKLAFNPGGRQIKMGKKWLGKYLEATDLIFVNRQEAESITGYENTLGSEKELLHGLSKLGPKMCVITDGEGGSFAYDGTHYVKAGVLPIDSFERTGAGDAFSTGCLAAIIQGKSLNEALVWGTVNSASVIGYIGPQKGLLTTEKLPEWINRAKECDLEAVEF